MTMDTLLVAVTGLSLTMALGMGVVVARLLREERRRSNARVEALLAMAAEPPRSTSPVARDTEHVAHGTPHVARGLPLDLDLRPANARSERNLFAQPSPSSAWGARAAVAAALVVIVGGIGWLALGRGPGVNALPAAAQAEEAPAAAGAPLELLSLRYAQQDGNLAVTGLVQNPRAGAPLTRVVATAFAFGPDGAFLASGRAPLDFTTLAPGDESPFVVNIPVSGAVARYRIGFRAEDGAVIAHIDKRSAADALAQR